MNCDVCGWTDVDTAVGCLCARVSPVAVRYVRRIRMVVAGGVTITQELLGKHFDIEHQYEEQKLRKLLWLRHGCELAALYGDDGEMQCGRCMVDFKKAPIEDLARKYEAVRS